MLDTFLVIKTKNSFSSNSGPKKRQKKGENIEIEVRLSKQTMKDNVVVDFFLQHTIHTISTIYFSIVAYTQTYQ